MERSSFLQRISRVLHWVGEVTSRSGTSVTVFLLVLIFGSVLAAYGFPNRWEMGFSTVVSAFTLIMLSLSNTRRAVTRRFCTQTRRAHSHVAPSRRSTRPSRGRPR